MEGDILGDDQILLNVEKAVGAAVGNLAEFGSEVASGELTGVVEVVWLVGLG